MNVQSPPSAPTCNGVRCIYQWGDAQFVEGFERRVEVAPLEFDELLSLRDFLMHTHLRSAVADGSTSSMRSAVSALRLVRMP